MFSLAFALGLMSSLHCVGMCGPIALALPVHQRSKIGKLGGILMYNLGRISTYTILGMLLGSVGSGLQLAGLQSSLSIGAGVLMVAAVAYSTHWLDQLSAPTFLQRQVLQLKNKLSQLLRQRTISALFMLGILNGLLPCGLVYMALLSSVAMGNYWEGGLYMAIFGLGTIPAMSAVAFFKNIFSIKLRSQARRYMPVVVAVAGIVLILRGLYITSWNGIETHNQEIPVCHGKQK